MNRGFSLIELILALLLLEVGVLATVSMFFLSQQNLRRAELTLRGVLETEWAADSLLMTGMVGQGGSSLPWGELLWAPADVPWPGLRVVAWAPVENDTLAFAYAWSPVEATVPYWPEPPALGGGR